MEDVLHDPERLEEAELLGHRSFFYFEKIRDKTLRRGYFLPELS